MSNYFDAISMIRSGSHRIGAIPVKQSEFQAIADEAYKASEHHKKLWAMVRVEDDGTSKVFGFDNEDTAKGAFSAVTSQTPGSALVALYTRPAKTFEGHQDKDDLFDVSFRKPRIVETTKTVETEKVREVEKKRSFLPWILGGIAGGIGLLIAVGKGRHTRV